LKLTKEPRDQINREDKEKEIVEKMIN